MRTVVETDVFIADAKAAGMTEAERVAAIDAVAADPLAGDVIQGSGGCRKVRVRGKGRGKSGGYRVVTYYADANLPVYLLAVLSKGARANFSKADLALMREVAKTIKASKKKG